MAVDLPLTSSLFATAHRFLWHAPSDTAILADVHLGIETALSDQGIYLPHVQGALLRRQWRALLDRRPAHVIINGDLFDQPTPDKRAVESCRDLFAQLPSTCRLTVVRGNHDPSESTLRDLLGPAANIAPDFVLDDLLISHGDLEPRESADATDEAWRCWIVGHQHPTVTFRTSTQHAKMHCYALSHFMRNAERRRLIILPAFSPLSLGCNLLEDRQWLLPLPRPANAHIRIAGIVDRQSPAPPSESQVLDFGLLSGLEV